MRKKNIVFFGAGNIVTGYQNNLKNCHLNSLNTSKDFNILGVVDSDNKNAKIFSDHSGSAIFEMADLLNLDIDIIAICTPTNTHYQLINEILEMGIKPKCFFCEKPFTDSLRNAKKIILNLELNDIGLIVGYQRSFLSDFKKIFDEYKNKEYGSLLNANVKYSKGLLNNGSHALDLLFCLFEDLKLEGFGDSFNDYCDSDLSSEVFFKNEGRSISLTPLNEKCFSIFEIDIIFEKKRFRFTDNCFSLEEYSLEADRNYPGYHSINSNGYTETNMKNSLEEMWSQIYFMLSKRNYFNRERVLFPHKIVDKFKTSR